MPVQLQQKPSRIDASVFERLDKYVEEHYIPPESIPKGSLYLHDHSFEVNRPRSTGKGKNNE